MKKYLIYFIIFLSLIISLSIIFFPIKDFECIDEISNKYNVDESIIYSVIKIESNFNDSAISPKGAIGLMQIMPTTGRWIAEINNLSYSDKMLLDPKYNIQIGTIFLKYLIDRYDGDLKKVIIAYNAGPTRVEDGRWEDFKETKNYIIKFRIAYFFYKIRLFYL